MLAQRKVLFLRLRGLVCAQKAFPLQQSAWWRPAKRGFLIPLLLPTATSQMSVMCWLCVCYEDQVAVVAFFFAKKVIDIMP